MQIIMKNLNMQQYKHDMSKKYKNSFKAAEALLTKYKLFLTNFNSNLIMPLWLNLCHLDFLACTQNGQIMWPAVT